MSTPDRNYLIKQLLANQLSGAELDEFLAGLHEEATVRTYSDVLETHFKDLLNEPNPPPEADPRTG